MIRIAKATAIIVTTLAALAAFWELRGPLLVFAISLLVAAAVREPVDYLVGRGWPKYAALAAIYLVSLSTLAGLILFAVLRGNSELSQLAGDFRRLYEYVSRHWSAVPWIAHYFDQRLPQPDELLATVVGNHGEQIVRFVLGTAFGLLGAVVDAVFVIVLSIYWTIDHEYFERLWLSILPLQFRISARKLLRMLEAELGAYVRSEMTQSLLAGLLLGMLFSLLGLNYPILVALMAALSWLVPWLGVIIALLALIVCEMPLLILEWPHSLAPLVAAAVFTAFVFLVLEFVVEPRLFSRGRYNSLFIVLAVMALSETFGVLGLLLGPMAAVIVQATVEHLERERIIASGPVADMSDLETRIEDMRTAAASRNEFPREWMSILDRLAALVGKTREILE